jgi:hypothetical protein
MLIVFMKQCRVGAACSPMLCSLAVHAFGLYLSAMELRHLRYFVTVAEELNITLAPAEVGPLPHPNAVFIPLKPPVPSVASAAAQRKDETNPLLKELLDCCHRRRW